MEPVKTMLPADEAKAAPKVEVKPVIKDAPDMKSQANQPASAVNVPDLKQDPDKK